MKRVLIISILLISCIVGGCVGSEPVPEVQCGGIQTGVMTCYDKDINAAGTGSVIYTVVLVDSNGNAYQAARVNDPSFYASVEIGHTYELEIHRVHNHDLDASKIAECDTRGEI